MRILTLTFMILLAGCAQSPKEKYLAERCKATLNFTGILVGDAEACYQKESAKLRCKDYGFAEGTSDFAKCLMNIDTERKIKKEINDEAERTRNLIWINSK